MLLSYGLNVIVLSRTKNNFLKYSENLSPDFKKKIFWKKLDLRKGSSIEKISTSLKRKKIRFLINNAAYSNRGKFFPYNHKNLNEELWGTFAGSMLLTEKILPQLRKTKNSKIIFTGSLWGKKTPRFKIYKDLDIGPSYRLWKSAILQYSKLQLREKQSLVSLLIPCCQVGFLERQS